MASSSTTTYRVRYASGDQQFEAEGDKSFVAQMVELFAKEGHLPSVPHTSTRQDKVMEVPRESTSGRKDEKPYSVSEFVHHLGVKKHMDLVLTFGFFLGKYSGLKEFTAADITACYYQAKMESSNTSQMISQNIKKGFIMEARGSEKGGGKRYTLTRAGEDKVEALLKS